MCMTPTHPSSCQIIKVYASSFHCSEFDNGRGDIDRYMSASLTVDCESTEYTEVLITATISLVVVPSIILIVFYFFVIGPIVPYIEARTKRSGVSPLVDFMIAKWKPTKWHFAFIDVVTT